MSDFDAEEYEAFRLAATADDELDEELDDDEVEDDEVDDDDEVEDEDDEVEDEDDELDEEDEDDELEDAEEDEIDFVVAAYREDGQAYVQALSKDLANDLDELILQLRRLPGDAGALGFVSLVEEVLVLVRVRGQHVQVLLSDSAAAADWPIARDVVDFLGLEVPEEDEESEAVGDLGILADLGMSDFDMGSLVDDLDLSTDQVAQDIADKIKIGEEFRRVVDAFLAR